jgi:hypothetical protein
MCEVRRARMSSDNDARLDSRAEADPDGTERDETATQRADRNWDELLQELRVNQTGIRTLSGLLLTLPFQQRFTALNGPLRVLFLTAIGAGGREDGCMAAVAVEREQVERPTRWCCGSTFAEQDLVPLGRDTKSKRGDPPTAGDDDR